MFNNANGFTGDDSEIQQVNWEGWTPPWMQGEGHGPRGGWGQHGPSGHEHEHSSRSRQGGSSRSFRSRLWLFWLRTGHGLGNSR